MQAFLITGTDTGVGKTVATCALARGLKKSGAVVFLHKPVESGGDDDCRKLSVLADNDELINTYQFRTPVAPKVASEIEQKEISWALITQNIETLKKDCDFLLVEGAGGLLVPVTADATYLELAKSCQLLPIVVAANKLGVINHFSLTLEVLAASGIPAYGFIVNEISEENSDVSKETNHRELKRIGDKFGAKFLGVLPYGENQELLP